MSKNLMFQVELEMTEDVTSENQINEMSQNIAFAIVNEAHNGGRGIAPDLSEAYTHIVRVKGWYSDKTIIEHVF